MKSAKLDYRKGFRVSIGNARSQAAVMCIAPGGAEGHAHNRHKGADQWLLVLSGTGRAKVNGRSKAIGAGSLLLIEHGDEHEIRNTGRTLLKTVNFYVPPAYYATGDERAAGKPAEKGR